MHCGRHPTVRFTSAARTCHLCGAKLVRDDGDPMWPCPACHIPRMPSGACFHCDDACNLQPCPACKVAHHFDGSGPATAGTKVPAAWPDGTPI